MNQGFAEVLSFLGLDPSPQGMHAFSSESIVVYTPDYFSENTVLQPHIDKLQKSSVRSTNTISKTR